MPIEEGSHPLSLAFGVLLFDFLVLVGSFGYAFKITILSIKVWQITLIAYPLLVIADTALDFYAGGYIAFEMFTHALLVLFLTAIFIAPIVMYLSDFNHVESEI